METILQKFQNLSIKEPSDEVGEVGFVYHPDTLLHSMSENDFNYQTKAQHVENPNRLMSILSHLQEKNLLERCNVINNFEPCNKQDIYLLHKQSYVEYVSNLWQNTNQQQYSYSSGDTYYNKYSIRAAELAVAGTLIATEKILKGEWKKGYAAVRPPGHHADIQDQISGFCFYNNVAIAIRYAQKYHNLKKFVVLDWDVHHGNSTQEFFYQDENILYISLHRYDQGNFYPGKSGDSSNIGSDNGKYYNINIPWNTIEDKYIPNSYDFIYAFERFILPVIKEFQPEFIYISAGFDSSINDPLGCIEYTVDGYAYVTSKLLEYMNNKNVLIVLEGGYNFSNLSLASEGVLRILLNEQLPLVCSEWNKTQTDIYNTCIPQQPTIQLINQLIQLFISKWNTLNTPELLTFQQHVEQYINNVESIHYNIPSNTKKGRFIVTNTNQVLFKTNIQEIDIFLDELTDLSNNHTKEERQILNKLVHSSILRNKDIIKLANGTEYVQSLNWFNDFIYASFIEIKLDNVTPLGFSVSEYEILNYINGEFTKKEYNSDQQISNDEFLKLLFKDIFSNRNSLKEQLLLFIKNFLYLLSTFISIKSFNNTGIYIAWNDQSGEYQVRLVGLDQIGKIKPFEQDNETIQTLENLQKFITDNS